MSKRLTIEGIKEELIRIAPGYELLSEVYINCKTHLLFQCKNKHVFKALWQNFYHKQSRCPTCHWNKRKKYKGQNLPYYDTYAHQLEYAHDVKRNETDRNILEVKCHYCEKFFVPKMTDVFNRIRSLNGYVRGENNLYCSRNCKESCPVFNRSKFRRGEVDTNTNYRPYQSEWAKMIKERAGHECERCGSKKELIAHHIKPVKTYPHLQADLDNGICVCRNCDREFFHRHDGCSTGELAHMNC